MVLFYFVKEHSKIRFCTKWFKGMKFEANILEKEIKRMAKGIEIEFGVQCELTYTPDYPPLYNNPELTALVAESLRNIDGDEDIKEIKEFPALAPSEDFAYYAEKFPACFFYIACSPKGVSEPYFNPKFDIDEDALLVAAKAVGQVICEYYQLN